MEMGGLPSTGALCETCFQCVAMVSASLGVGSLLHNTFMSSELQSLSLISAVKTISEGVAMVFASLGVGSLLHNSGLKFELYVSMSVFLSAVNAPCKESINATCLWQQPIHWNQNQQVTCLLQNILQQPDLWIHSQEKSQSPPGLFNALVLVMPVFYAPHDGRIDYSHLFPFC